MKIKQRLLTKNQFSRPGIQLRAVRGVVVHWVANPGTTARGNWQYFENRKGGATGYGSAHYIIDQDGVIIQAIPDSELAYHVGASNYKPEAVKKLSTYPNNCTLGIECTHQDWSGIMTTATYKSLVELCAHLCSTYGLNPAVGLYRHYDVTGKDCHRWFVEKPERWDFFKRQVALYGK